MEPVDQSGFKVAYKVAVASTCDSGEKSTEQKRQQPILLHLNSYSLSGNLLLPECLESQPQIGAKQNGYQHQQYQTIAENKIVRTHETATHIKMIRAQAQRRKPGQPHQSQ